MTTTHAHEWRPTGKEDAEGNELYRCACDEELGEDEMARINLRYQEGLRKGFSM